MSSWMISVVGASVCSKFLVLFPSTHYLGLVNFITKAYDVKICPVIYSYISYHITAEAPLSALKSAIAKNGMGVTSSSVLYRGVV